MRVSNRPMPVSQYAVDVALRWSDMDAYGHVNNVQFLRLLEDARVAALADWLGNHDMLDSGIVVNRHEIEYLAPLVFRPAPVRIRLWPTAITATGFDVAYEMVDPPEVGTGLYARAESGLVAFDFDTGRPRRLSADVRDRLRDLSGETVRFRWRRR